MTQEQHASAARVRFGSLERRGIVGFVTIHQLIALLALVAFAWIFKKLVPSPYGAIIFLALLLVGGTLILVTYHKRTLGEYLWQILSYHLRKYRGRLSWKSSASMVGVHADGREVAIPLPSQLGRLAILSFPLPNGLGEMGVLVNRQKGTYTALVATHGMRSFALAEDETQLRLMAGYAESLAFSDRERCPIDRIGWILRSVPGDRSKVVQSAKANIVPSLENTEYANAYIRLVSGGNNIPHDRELFFAVRLNVRHASSEISAENKTGAWKSSGLTKADYGPCAVLAREVTSFAMRLQRAEIGVKYLLGPRRLAGVIRTAHEPSARLIMSALHHAESDLDLATSPRNAWPLKTEEAWSYYRTAADAFHCTFWIRNWPRTERGINFLAPLLMGVEARYTVCVGMEPQSSSRAMRRTKMARTHDEAEFDQRQRKGLVDFATSKQQRTTVLEREEELAQGHTDTLFNGFITVTAESEYALRSACDEVVAAAIQSGLELEREDGAQDIAFSKTLPMVENVFGSVF